MLVQRVIDKSGRVINYLLGFVSDRCNLRFIYFTPKKGSDSLLHSELLTDHGCPVRIWRHKFS